ncbi:MAG: hypothetical protein K6G18_09845 [Treponema sp.]|nr:hypothetical protein [Treponema sp.]
MKVPSSFPQPSLPVLCCILFLLPVVLTGMLSCGRAVAGAGMEGHSQNGLYSYAAERQESYRSAMALYGELAPALEERELGNSDFALAIVFPEMLRYNRFRNWLEFLATELVYTLSPSFTGCTIGHFQMNVAFAETIERYVSLSPVLKAKYPAINYGGGNRTFGDRNRRVGRINCVAGEADYLFAFIEVCTEKFSLWDLGDEDRLVLLATAYNAGMSRSREELERVSTVNSYPSGLNSSKSKWNYAAIALEFYQGRGEPGGR